MADLQAAGEVTGAAVQGLEATLAAIERAESRRASQGPAAAPSRRSRTPPGRTAVPSTRQSAAGQLGSTRTQAASKRSSRDDAAAEQQQQQIVSSRSGSSDEGEGDGGVLGDAAAAGSSVAVLSRELVKAQMASADLQRKLRVGARYVAAWPPDSVTVSLCRISKGWYSKQYCSIPPACSAFFSVGHGLRQAVNTGLLTVIGISKQ